VDTQVKERLTGAAILVALVVLLVPELLTGSGGAARGAPSQAHEPAMRSYTVDLAEGGTQQQAMPVTLPAKEPPAIIPATSESLQATLVVKPPVVKPPTALQSTPVSRPARAVIAEAAPVTGWSIQLGSFQSPDNAKRLVRQLKGKGFTAFVLEGGGTSGKLYRVRVGPAADRAAAATLAAKLRDAGQPGSIVPYP
jgi:DedD protein